MAKTDYIRTSDADFAQQLLTFKTTIGGYAATVGVTPAQVTAQAADADYFNYVLASREIMQNGAQQWGGWRNLIRNGGKPPPAGAPVAPTFPAAVPAVAPGVESRFRALAQQIKASANYNNAIGEALGIEGAQQTGPDLSALKPVIDAVVSGNQVNITWGWGGNSAFLDMIELQVDRNDGKGFVLLAYDTTPELYRHAVIPVRADQVALPSHLSGKRRSRRPMEQSHFRRHRWLGASRSEPDGH